MRSVCISYNFSTRSIFDAYEPNNEKDISRFIARVAQDRTASPASEIRAFRLFEDGSSEVIE